MKLTLPQVLGLLLVGILLTASLYPLSLFWPGTALRPQLPLCLRAVDLVAVISLVVCLEWLIDSVVFGIVNRFGPIPVDALVMRFGMLAEARTLLVLSLLLLLRFGMGIPAGQLGFRDRSWRRHSMFGVAQLVVWLPATLAMTAAARTLFQQQHVHLAQQFLASAQGPAEWLLLLYCVVPMAALPEELVFRGLIQGCLNHYFRPATAILATAILFGFAHAPTWPDPLPLMVLGVGLGIAYQRTGSLWAPIAFHATFNAGNVALWVLSDGRG